MSIIRSLYSLNSLTPLTLLTHSASLCFSSGSWLWLLCGHICPLWSQLRVWRRCHLQWVKLPTHGHCCQKGSNTSNSSHASGVSLTNYRYAPVSVAQGTSYIMYIWTRIISGRFELLPLVYKRWCCERDQQSVYIHDVQWFHRFLTTLAVSGCARYL